tara:strand:+ start:181 stop:483 length:303 start_codon:yes stop_codon:yes gene_type:complete
MNTKEQPNHVDFIVEWEQVKGLSDKGVGWRRDGNRYDLIGYVTYADTNVCHLSVEDNDGVFCTYVFAFPFAKHHAEQIIGTEQYFVFDRSFYCWWLPNMI